MKLEEKYGVIKEGIMFGNVRGNTSLRILKIQLSSVINIKISMSIKNMDSDITIYLIYSCLNTLLLFLLKYK